MTWVKFEHDTALNRKVAPLSDAAFRMWFRMIGWSVGAGTDGLVSRSIPRSLFTEHKTPQKLEDELLAAGLLDEDPEGVYLHDFADYQLSGAEQKAQREAAAARKRRERATRRAGVTA